MRSRRERRSARTTTRIPRRSGSSSSGAPPRCARSKGKEELAAGEAVCFPAGPAGAHQVLNRAPETARVLMVSTRTHPAIAVYPDGDKIGTFTGREADSKMFRRESAVGYYDGETEDGI